MPSRCRGVVLRSKELGPVLFFLFVVVFLISLVYYNQTTSSSVRPAGISISDFQLVGVQSVNASGSTLVLEFVIKNATPLGVTLNYATYIVYGDSSYIGRGVIEQSVKIPARGSASAYTDFLVPLQGSIQGTWDYFINGGNVSWRAIGDATITQTLTGSLAVEFNCLSSPGYSSISCSYVLH